MLREDRAEAAARDSTDRGRRHPNSGRDGAGGRDRPGSGGEESWIFGGVVGEGPRAPSTGRQRTGQAFDLPTEVRAELAAAVGRERATKLGDRLAAAARAYERDRYVEALRITKPLVAAVPESAALRELHGLVCYRLGRFKEAIGHLEAARTLGGDDPSQLPVLMDCRRALGHRRLVAELWEELRGASPDPDVLAEGRLVLASDLADRGQIQEATTLLVAGGAGRNLRHPAERHVRQWYVLADLAERAGDIPRARDLFARVVDADPELADASSRLAGLGRVRRRR